MMKVGELIEGRMGNGLMGGWMDSGEQADDG